MPRLRSIIVIFLMLLVIVLSGCTKQEQVKYDRDFFAMDTYITCQVLSADEEQAAKALDAVQAAFMEIDRLTNRFAQDSEITAVNRNAGVAPVKVSTDVFAMAETSLAWSDQSEGAFNILIGDVMDLWGFGSDHPTVPSQEALEAALTKTDYHQIVLDKANSTIYLPEQGMVMDLGGVAKGYATDKAVAALEELGIDNALINAGGNVYALGRRADGTPWKVGVQDPQNPQGIKTVLQGRDTALVSSGDYQRYFEKDGVRYHHILDPASGTPARASAGTTVIMQSATLADILSTTLFVKGPLEGIKLAERLEEVEAALIITRDGKIYTTQNLNEYLAED
ncbi:MAG TPA: FAD:protein FMN transferase [Syntrophomonas sp.]|nr:FAD:protein FMN transferase [Syntrophomonas sp.]